VSVSVSLPCACGCMSSDAFSAFLRCASVSRTLLHPYLVSFDSDAYLSDARTCKPLLPLDTSLLQL
jgi:hypothetical protein